MLIRLGSTVLLMLGLVSPLSAEPMTSTDKIVATFMELDSDQSTTVSFPEYMAMVQERAQNRFLAMDLNHDQQVTEEEYRTFWSTQKSKWYRLNK